MTWWNGPLATFDLETTGVEPEEARIVSAAFIFLDEEDQVLPNSFSRIVNPEMEIPSGAMEVHGITQEQAESTGLDRKEMVERIFLSFHRAKKMDIPVVIYNAKFDLTLFLAELNRLTGLQPAIGPLIDPLVIDRALDKYRKGGRKLETVAAHYGVSLDNAHAAAADAIASAKIARAIGDRHGPLIANLNKLQEAQRVWFEQWRDGLNAWWKRKGIDRSIPVSEVWPTHLDY